MWFKCLKSLFGDHLRNAVHYVNLFLCFFECFFESVIYIQYIYIYIYIYLFFYIYIYWTFAMFYSTVTMWLSKLLSISQCDFSSQDFDCQNFYFISYNMILISKLWHFHSRDYFNSDFISQNDHIYSLCDFISHNVIYSYLKTDFIVTIFLIFATLYLSKLSWNCDSHSYESCSQLWLSPSFLSQDLSQVPD